MRTLLNDTPNVQVKKVLEELSCVWEIENEDGHEEDFENGVAPLTSDHMSPSKAVDNHHNSYAKDEPVDNYEESMQHDGDYKVFMDIQPELLPCPQKVKQALEDPATTKSGASDDNNEYLDNESILNEQIYNNLSKSSRISFEIIVLFSSIVLTTLNVICRQIT